MRTTIKFYTEHFAERFVQRFSEEDLPHLEKTIQKAFEKAEPNQKLKYTHPYYGFTVVIRRIALNGIQLITCWKQGIEVENVA